MSDYLRLFFSLLARLLPAVLSGDLLYLYYAGGWVEPVRWIELSELVLLYVFIAVSILWTIIAARRVLTDTNTRDKVVL